MDNYYGFQSAAGKQRAKTLRTYNYGDQTSATILSNDGLILLFAHKLQEGSEEEKLVWAHFE